MTQGQENEVIQEIEISWIDEGNITVINNGQTDRIQLYFNENDIIFVTEKLNISIDKEVQMSYLKLNKMTVVSLKDDVTITDITIEVNEDKGVITLKENDTIKLVRYFTIKDGIIAVKPSAAAPGFSVLMTITMLVVMGVVKKRKS
ncbi:hypothetical protein KAJ41_02485 [Candidatus Parcubacteria bacterium]|nr:hypothetical protein [Candidatus Parcubacteria bacterium]